MSQIIHQLIMKWLTAIWPYFTIGMGILGMALVSVFFVVKSTRDKIFQWAGFIMAAILIILGFKTKRGDD